MVACQTWYGFAKQSTGSESSTAREDDILPYNGWANDFTKLQFSEQPRYAKNHTKNGVVSNMVETGGLDLTMVQPPRKPAAGKCPPDTCISMGSSPCSFMNSKKATPNGVACLLLAIVGDVVREIDNLVVPIIHAHSVSHLLDKQEVSDFFFRYSLSHGFPHDRNNLRSPDVPAGLCHKAFHYPQRHNHTS